MAYIILCNLILVFRRLQIRWCIITFTHYHNHHQNSTVHFVNRILYVVPRSHVIRISIAGFFFQFYNSIFPYKLRIFQYRTSNLILQIMHFLILKFKSPICFSLRAHDWQKWTKSFLKCHCHKICRVQAVGLPLSNYAQNIKDFCVFWGKFGKIWYFVSNCLVKIWIYKSFCTCGTHIIMIICRTPHLVFPFYLFDFQINRVVQKMLTFLDANFSSF